MSKHCPIYGVAIYADCLECENKICKKEIEINNDPIYEFKTPYSPQDCLLNGHIYYIGNKIVSYECYIFNYRINIYTDSYLIEIHKAKHISDIPHLHYYYYCTKESCFFNEEVQKISQDELAILVNKNWSKSPNFVRSIRNRDYLRIIKRRAIEILIQNQQIIFDKMKDKYIGYDLYMFNQEMEERRKIRKIREDKENGTNI